jgi:N-acetylglucosaminyldiphosphoundecaprenol N-acetyl-beta-D-mannosaminyltransferase
MNKKANFDCNDTEKILSVNITTLTKKKILEAIAKRIKNNTRTVIFTPNPQILLCAQKSASHRRLLECADINIPDGIGIVIASKIKGGRIQCRVSGIDLASDILKIAQKKEYKIFLLGAKKGVAKKAAKNIKNRFPKIKICGTHHGYFKKNGEENQRVVKIIQKKKPDIVFVCFGYPTQERWILDNAPSLPTVKILIGLGGTLDVWSGNIRRAPILFKALGLEWLYRTLKEPKRARIFLDIPIFLFKALTQK